MRNKQQEVKPDFARVLGRVPCEKGGEALIRADLDEIVNTFGPAEIQRLKASNRLFWNFQTRDGVAGFSLWVEIPTTRKSTRNLDLEVSTKRVGDWEPFFDWIFARLGAVSGCYERPAVINGSGFVAVPA
jgi:hypothetical protein